MDNISKKKGKWIKVPRKECDCTASYYTLHGCEIAPTYKEDMEETCEYARTVYQTICSECGTSKISPSRSNYCPNCGAEMESE